MNTSLILGLAALAALALFTALAIAKTGRRRHDGSRSADGDSGTGYIGALDSGAHSSCDSGSAGDSGGGGDCGGSH